MPHFFREQISFSFTVFSSASLPASRRASATATVITVSSVYSQFLPKSSNSLLLLPLSNSNWLPIMSPVIAPYIHILLIHLESFCCTRIVAGLMRPLVEWGATFIFPPFRAGSLYLCLERQRYKYLRALHEDSHRIHQMSQTCICTRNFLLPELIPDL